MHNLLEFNILKDAETIQEVAIFMQKEAGMLWFKFSGNAHGFWTDPKILEVFWWNFAGTHYEDDRMK